MEDVGLDVSNVALVLSVQSIALTIFKFAIGFIYDRTGLRITSNICFVTSVIILVILACVTDSPTGKVLAMIYGVGVSLAMPLETIMLPIYAADLFGEHSYNKLLGIVSAVNTAGYALGSPVANLCYDITGSYNIALYGGAALMVVATVVMQFVISAAHKEQKKVE